LSYTRRFPGRIDRKPPASSVRPQQEHLAGSSCFTAIGTPVRRLNRGPHRVAGGGRAPRARSPCDPIRRPGTGRR